MWALGRWDGRSTCGAGAGTTLHDGNCGAPTHQRGPSPLQSTRSPAHLHTPSPLFTHLHTPLTHLHTPSSLLTICIPSLTTCIPSLPTCISPDPCLPSCIPSLPPAYPFTPTQHPPTCILAKDCVERLRTLRKDECLFGACMGGGVELPSWSSSRAICCYARILG